MTVYVDEMRAPLGRMVMCHMVADTEDELLSMADRIGLQRKWHQHAGTHRSHFDVSLRKRALAIQYGAREITRRQLGEWLRARRIADEALATAASTQTTLRTT